MSRRERRRAANKAQAASAGRATAAVLAASGLVISTGVAANATESSNEGRESSTVQLNASELNVERASQQSAAAVTASSDVELTFDRPAVSSEAAPQPDPAPAVQATTASHQTQQQTETQSQPQAQPQAEQQTQAQPAQQQAQPQAEEQAQPQAEEQTQSQPQTQTYETGATTAGEAEQPSAPSGGGSAVVSAAYSTLGTPHVMGGTTPGAGLDCSGMIQYAYAQAGISVPRTTYGMMGLPQVSSPQPGDIVISNGGGHGGIYVGNGQVISTTSSGGVRVHGLHESWHQVTSYHRPG